MTLTDDYEHTPHNIYEVTVTTDETWVKNYDLAWIKQNTGG